MNTLQFPANPDCALCGGLGVFKSPSPFGSALYWPDTHLCECVLDRAARDGALPTDFDNPLDMVYQIEPIPCPSKAAIRRRQPEGEMPHLKPVTVGRYEPEVFSGPKGSGTMPGGHGWLGWVETEDWIVWEHEDGTLWIGNGRDETGAVIDPQLTAVPRQS